MLRALLAAALLSAAPAGAVDPVPTTPGPTTPPPSASAPGADDDARSRPTVGETPPAPPRPDVRTVAGKIAAIEPSRRALTLAAADGPLRVELDRNTMVFLESRLGSLRDLAVGVPARVNVSGPSNLASFVELKPRGVAPTAGGAPAPSGS
jgi:hypothetical protein